jgi:hypothetical protein
LFHSITCKFFRNESEADKDMGAQMITANIRKAVAEHGGKITSIYRQLFYCLLLVYLLRVYLRHLWKSPMPVPVGVGALNWKQIQSIAFVYKPYWPSDICAQLSDLLDLEVHIYSSGSTTCNFVVLYYC